MRDWTNHRQGQRNILLNFSKGEPLLLSTENTQNSWLFFYDLVGLLFAFTLRHMSRGVPYPLGHLRSSHILIRKTVITFIKNCEIDE